MRDDDVHVAVYAELDAAHLMECGLAVARELLADKRRVGHEVVEASDQHDGRVRVFLVPPGARAVVLVESATTTRRLLLPADLTPREAQVARLAAGQQDNAEIGEALGLKRSTVRAHLRSCYRKSRAQPDTDGPPARGRRSPRERSLDQALRRAGLTERQAAVARLAAAGLTNKQIGAALGLSAHTVGPHLSEVYRRLGVSRRAELVARLLARR